MAKRRWRHRARVAEDVVARAARLGITPERVLSEYARIAFSNMRQIVEWDDASGITVKPSSTLSADDVAAIAEIVAAAKGGRIYRIKLHDKKPVLDSIARHLDMLPASKEMPDDNTDAPLAVIENPREFILHELDLADAEDAAKACQRPE